MTIFSMLAIICGGSALSLCIFFLVRGWIRESKFYSTIGKEWSEIDDENKQYATKQWGEFKNNKIK